MEEMGRGAGLTEWGPFFIKSVIIMMLTKSFLFKVLPLPRMRVSECTFLQLVSARPCVWRPVTQ